MMLGTDLSIIPSAGSYNYYMSVCGAVQASTCGSHPSAFLCQVRKSPLNQFEAVNAYSDGKHTPEPIWSPSPYGIGMHFTKHHFINTDTDTPRKLNTKHDCH